MSVSVVAGVDASTKLYKDAENRYVSGVGNILDLMIAQSALANAKGQRIKALTDWRDARLQLAEKLGTIGMWSLKEEEVTCFPFLVHISGGVCCLICCMICGAWQDWCDATV